MRLSEPLLDCWLARKDYLQISAFPDLVVVEREGALHALQRKATGRAVSKVVKETAGWMWPDLTLGTSTSAFTKPFLCGGDGKRSRRNSR